MVEQQWVMKPGVLEQFVDALDRAGNREFPHIRKDADSTEAYGAVLEAFSAKFHLTDFR